MCIQDVRDEEPSQKEINEAIERDCLIDHIASIFEINELAQMIYEKLTVDEKNSFLREIEIENENEKSYLR